MHYKAANHFALYRKSRKLKKLQPAWPLARLLPVAIWLEQRNQHQSTERQKAGLENPQTENQLKKALGKRESMGFLMYGANAGHGKTNGGPFFEYNLLETPWRLSGGFVLPKGQYEDCAKAGPFVSCLKPAGTMAFGTAPARISAKAADGEIWLAPISTDKQKYR